MRKALVFSLVMCSMSLTLLELSFQVLSRFIPADYYYKAPTPEEFRTFLEKQSEEPLGWRPAPETLTTGGFRISPAHQGLSTPCLSLYGDSFTFGDEVEPEEAWGNVLTRLLGCRVDNYGVSGYGTDQAYLYFTRHQREGLDQAPIVILSHLSENIVRNITHNHHFIYGSGIHLKPRFVPERHGALRLIPIPPLSLRDYEAYVRDPGQFLPYDALLPGSSVLAKRRLGFPYLWTVPYMFTYKRIYSSVLSYAAAVPPWFAALYTVGHPSQALQLTRDILVHFATDATHYSKNPLIFIIPTARDMRYFQHSGHWSYDNLLSVLRAQGVQRLVNLGPRLLSRVQQAHLCDYFCTQKATRSGHYTAAGNRLLAEVAREILIESGLWPLPVP